MCAIAGSRILRCHPEQSEGSPKLGGDPSSQKSLLRMTILRSKFKIAFFIFLSFLFQTTHALSIIQKPIIFNQTRIKLTQVYQREHYGIASDSIAIKPQIIVLHWTQTATLTQAFNEFNSPYLPSQRSELPGRLNVSAHYLVDRDGTIYQLMPDHWMARHVIGLNHCAIGIENVGGVNDEPDLTEAQAQANANLILYLKNKYPSIRYVIGHMDYLQFKNTPLWLEKNPHYRTIKQDPGKDFMQRVKLLINKL